MDACRGGLVFRVGRLGLGLAKSTALAVHIAELLRDHLVEAGAPHDLRVEVDADQACQVPAGWESRSLLPHHDSNHCSFLTPSILDVPGWRPEERATHGSGITRTDTHKLYQGFLVVHSGDAVGTTSFFNKIAVLRRAFSATNGRGCSLLELAEWLEGNLRRARRTREQAGGTYLTLASCLGTSNTAWHAVPLHWSEAGFDRSLITRFPELATVQQVADTARRGAVGLLFEQQIQTLLGLNMNEFRMTFESVIRAQAHDLVFGHNIAQLHGARGGTRTRVLRPICLVRSAASGEEYERWLARAWRLAWHAD